ncbi:MAG: D-xylose transport system permease protein, partial [Solirubrobacterales bacterium]|nr:D-xylose transport system permease protein [Solirubrobacterales bacterium]
SVSTTPAASGPPAGAPVTSGLSAFWRRVSQGDIGSLPVIAGLVLIWIVFDILNPLFLSPGNLTNLATQVADIGIVSVGIVLVLLLGEIDLSVGSVYGLCSAITALLSYQKGWAALPAIAAGLLAGAAIGTFQGFFFTRFKIPSFVVTLAGLLTWFGAQLHVMGEAGTININDPSLVNLANYSFGPTVGWGIAIVVSLILGVDLFIRRRRRAAAGLPQAGLVGDVVKFVAVVAVLFGGVAVLLSYHGVPLPLLILLGFVVSFDIILTRTKFGRHIFAVGGNAEAARRAGISVNGIRIAVFTLCGTMAAAGGIMGASRVLEVSYSSGTGDTLLNAIAGAVIGGTSLFGGRGTVWSAFTGALVIGSINNGLALLSAASDVKFMVTGGVLLAAVTIDAVARQGRQRAGV